MAASSSWLNKLYLESDYYNKKSCQGSKRQPQKGVGSRTRNTSEEKDCPTKVQLIIFLNQSLSIFLVQNVVCFFFPQTGSKFSMNRLAFAAMQKQKKKKFFDTKRLKNVLLLLLLHS
jgi:hypothetical protein